MMLPNMIRIKIDEKMGKSINVYIPTIVILILLLPVLVLAFPVWLLAVVILASNSRGLMLRLMPGALCKLFCASKGTDIMVHDENTDVVIKIY